MKLLAAILLMTAGAASAHGLSPTRLEAPAGSKLIAHRFTASNGDAAAQIYTVECFKGGLSSPYPCKFSPQALILARNGTRSFRVQIETSGDGLYLVCTRQEPRDENQLILTRVCARFGVGVPASTQPDDPRKYSITRTAAVPAGPR